MRFIGCPAIPGRPGAGRGTRAAKLALLFQHHRCVSGRRGMLIMERDPCAPVGASVRAEAAIWEVPTSSKGGFGRSWLVGVDGIG